MGERGPSGKLWRTGGGPSLPPGSPEALGGARAAGGTNGQCAASDLWRFGDLFPIRKMAEKAA